MTDPYAHLKDNAWREAQALDARLARGEIDEEAWHREWENVVAPMYLAAETPWGQSGKSGTAEDWEWSRSHVADAVDRAGSFLDVGCANGYLLECLPRWTSLELDLHGLEIAPALAELARARLPELADRIHVGNALTWEPRQSFTYVRTGLEYVPPARRQDLAERLLGCCERLVVGVFNEHENERTTEDAVESWGLAIAGRSVRENRWKPGMEYRVVWIDA